MTTRKFCERPVVRVVAPDFRRLEQSPRHETTTARKPWTARPRFSKGSHCSSITPSCAEERDVPRSVTRVLICAAISRNVDDDWPRAASAASWPRHHYGLSRSGRIGIRKCFRTALALQAGTHPAKDIVRRINANGASEERRIARLKASPPRSASSKQFPATSSVGTASSRRQHVEKILPC